jgi:hypothetical protein
MKRLLLLTRILFFLSFLLPFFFFQMCGPSKKEREVSITQAKQDSINAAVEAERFSDSIALVSEQIKLTDSAIESLKKTHFDSIFAAYKEARQHSPSKTNDSKSLERTLALQEMSLNEIIWIRMICPSDHAISGFGLCVFLIEYLRFYNLFELIIPINYFLSFLLLLLFIIKKIKLSRIFSMISILFFIIAVFQFHEQGILWGFWVAFTLNMIDLILVNMILYKPKPV